MVKFINAMTGSLMYVHESRVDEYIAAGHSPVAKEPVKKETVKKTTTRKKATK